MTADPRFLNAIESFKNAQSAKSRALAVRTLWEYTPPERSRRGQSDAWVAEQLKVAGVDTNSYEARYLFALGVLGHIADPLWERIDHPTAPLPVRTAYSMYSQAKRQAKEDGTTIEPVLVAILTEYDEWPATRLPDGRVIRKRPAGRLAPPKATSEVPSSKPAHRSPRPAAPAPTGDRDDWQTIREFLAAVVDDRLKETDEAIRSQLWREFESDLKTLVTEFQGKVDRARKRERQSAKVDAMVKFAHVRQACTQLMIDPPAKSGQPVDLTRANRQKKALARQYHPDLTGTEDTREAYEAVLGAYEILVSYNQQLRQSNPNLEVLEGGKQ